jgi:Zn finger protein HypA/HybF involved in hydrogenase expression
MEYVEVKVKCEECGKLSKIVVLEGTDTSEYLCPKCSVGDYADEEEDFG